jgi:FtsP/CotA-like multicopper oxidase with cupredoxin domain
MADDNFPTTTTALAQSVETPVVELAHGDEFDLEIAPVTKEIGGNTLRMLAYNGSIPGPTLRVQEGSEIVVNVRNEGDLEATVHWHGLRLDNRYDGTHETQAPIPVGGSFTYRVQFPDAGVYWYHPHIREDYGQELGLYGNIVVEPAEEDYWPEAHRELVLTLDDILIEDGKVAAFSHSGPSHVAMGRFGTEMLIGGQTDLSLEAKRGEIVRFFLTNTANTRVFRVGVAGAKVKLVGGDSGHVEREELVEDVVLAPSERVVLDVLFDEPGAAVLEHRTPEHTYRLATVEVSEDEAEALGDFYALRENADLAAERERIAPYLEAAPDKTLSLVAEMDMGDAEGETGVFACPMHADIVASWEGKCPKCGMKLMPAAADVPAPTEYACPMHPEITATWAGECPKCGMTLRPTGSGGHEEHHHGDEHHEEHGGHEHSHDVAGGIEWEDDMVEVNRETTTANTQWFFVDKDTGDRGHAIDWRFRVGDQVKLRLVNEMDSDHPMHHPFHVHGAGRFLVLSRGGVAEPNLVWKDTVLVRTGETVDILLDVTNPGIWMAHCHIAEHHESGMMFSFVVEP